LYRVEDKYFWFKIRRELILYIIKRFVSPKRVKILEIGCGNGNVSNFLLNNGYTIVGCDLFYEGLRFAKERNNKLKLIQGNVFKLPIKSKSFDIVCAFDVIEHLDDVRAIKEMERVCKNEGYIFITVPAFKFLWSYIDDISCHKRRYFIFDIKNLFNKYNIKLEYFTYFYFSLLPVYIISRKVLSKIFFKKNTKEISPEFRINFIINSVMYYIMKLELFFVKIFYKLPLGSSLFVVGRKLKG